MSRVKHIRILPQRIIIFIGGEQNENNLLRPFKLLIETEGLKILTDPYDPSVGYSAKFPEVDVVTISHEHFDHNAIKLVPHYNYVLKGNISKEDCKCEIRKH